jgi:hypothetical protein
VWTGTRKVYVGSDGGQAFASLAKRGSWGRIWKINLTRAFKTAAGGATSRSSYGGILSFHNLHCEIGYLLGPHEPRSLNPGGRHIFVAGNDDIYLSALRKCHGFRQLDFATLDDCLVGENLPARGACLLPWTSSCQAGGRDPAALRSLFELGASTDPLYLAPVPGLK